MLHAAWPILVLTIMSLTCILALIAGTWRERLAILTYVSGYALTYALTGMGLKPVVFRYTLSDLICLAIFCSLCWKAPRPWPILAMGLQLLAAMAEIVRLCNPYITDETFIFSEALANVAVLIVITAGTLASVIDKYVRVNNTPEIG